MMIHSIKWDLAVALSDSMVLDLGEKGERGLRADHACYDIACALGRARLYDVALGEIDGSLPVDMAIGATRHMSQVIARYFARAKTLVRDFHDCEEFIEAADVTCSCLEVRTDFWAVTEALVESTHLIATPGSVGELQVLKNTLEDLTLSVWKLDEALRTPENMLVLSNVATGTYLLANMRERICAKYRGKLPWWLDGTLEKMSNEPLKGRVFIC